MKPFQNKLQLQKEILYGRNTSGYPVVIPEKIQNNNILSLRAPVGSRVQPDKVAAITQSLLRRIL